MKRHPLLQIDEVEQIPQPVRPMFLKRIFCLTSALAAFASANTAEIPSGAVTLEQCIQIALENNLNVRMTYYEPRFADLQLKQYYGSYYDPSLSLSTRAYHNATKPIADPTQFSVGNQRDGFANRLGLSGNFTPIDTSYSLSLSGDGSEGEVQNPFNRINSIFGNSGAGFNFSITQPMLRNGWGVGHRRTIKLRKNNIKSSTLSVLGQIMTTVSEVEAAYYNWLAQYDKLKVDEENLKITERNFNNQKRRAEVGTLAKSELPQLQAELYAQKTALISAKNNYVNSMNSLKQLLSDDFAAIREIELSPAGELNAVKTVFSLSDSWDKALNQRPEILQRKILLKNNEINLKFSKNQLWPQLDLQAYYNLRGDDTAQVKKDEITGRPYIERPARFNRSFREVRGRDNPNYGIVLNFRMPIPNREARASYKNLQLQNEQALLMYKQLEQNIMLQIDNLIRAAETSFEQIAAASQARDSAELALQNQTKKFEEGAADNYSVLLAQRDLTRQRNDVINKKVAYLRSLSDLALAEGSTLKNYNINVEFDTE